MRSVGRRECGHRRGDRRIRRLLQVVDHNGQLNLSTGIVVIGGDDHQAVTAPNNAGPSTRTAITDYDHQAVTAEQLVIDNDGRTYLAGGINAEIARVGAFQTIGESYRRPRR